MNFKIIRLISKWEDAILKSGVASCIPKLRDSKKFAGIYFHIYCTVQYLCISSDIEYQWSHKSGTFFQIYLLNGDVIRKLMVCGAVLNTCEEYTLWMCITCTLNTEHGDMRQYQQRIWQQTEDDIDIQIEIVWWALWY